MSFTILDNRDKNELLELINSGVADGRSIVSINKTITGFSEDGHVQDTYTITYTDGTTSDFTVTNGKDGEDGKSAYEYAKDGGYTGTEEEFTTKLAEQVTTQFEFKYCKLLPATENRLKGETIERIEVQWELTKKPKSVFVDKYDDGMLVGSYTIENPEFFDGYVFNNITKNTEWVIVATSEEDERISTSVGVNFYESIFYGKASLPEVFDSTFLNSLENSVQATKHLDCINFFNSTGPDGNDYYYWYCAPQDFYERTFKFNGIEGGFILAGTASFTNDFGYTAEYNIYRSANPNLGNITVY